MMAGEEGGVGQPLHSVFTSFSIENDLSAEDFEWFRSRICREIVEEEENDQAKRSDGATVTRIVEAVDFERATERENKFFVKLKETNTIWLMSLETCFSGCDVIDAEKVREENEIYEMKKTKKEFLRKRCVAVVQTPINLEKSLGTLTAEINKADAAVFASEWDLYDTYSALLEPSSSEKPSGSVSASKTAQRSNHQKEELPSTTANSIDEINKTFESSNFKYATLITERLLASNSFQDKQSIFKRKPKTRYDDDPTSFSYNLELLWTFEKDFEHPLGVTALDWNPLNRDLLAVGYGDLTFENLSIGLVCIWSPKNPLQPEREFPIGESVTCLNFSQIKPNVLAVGTRGGKICIFDITDRCGFLKIVSSDNSRILPELVWKVDWFRHEEMVSEELLAVGEAGALMVLSFPEDEAVIDMLKLDYVAPREKFIEKKSCKKNVYFEEQEEAHYDRKIYSGLCFSILSSRNFCYVSTREGVLIKCKLRNPSMMDGAFLAHDGPVYTIEHSPVTDLIFLTCGADWNIRIWIEGLNRPLITLQNKAPVRCGRWSPTIPTMIASITGAEISVWDISRNILAPKSSLLFRNCEKPLSCISFSSNGENVVAGGDDGSVRVVHLSELPRIPFLQKEALVAALRNGLYRNKELIGPFLRLVKMNREQLVTQVKL